MSEFALEIDSNIDNEVALSDSKSLFSLSLFSKKLELSKMYSINSPNFSIVVIGGR